MAEYRIDDLALRAGTTVRNIRVYQDRGLLEPPRRQGRVGWYRDEHLERLLFIGRMLERGYTFATIRELLAAWNGGVELGEVLGLGEAIGGPWTEEEPGRITLGELKRRFGTGTEELFVPEAVRLGLLELDPADEPAAASGEEPALGEERDDEADGEADGASFRVPNPRLLDAGADMVAAGIPLTAVVAIAVGLRSHMDQVAGLFFSVLAANLPTGVTGPSGVAEVVTRLRPHAGRAVGAAFGLAMQDQARQVLAKLDARAQATPV